MIPVSTVIFVTISAAGGVIANPQPIVGLRGCGLPQKDFPRRGSERHWFVTDASPCRPPT